MWVEENTIIVRQWFTFEFDGWPQSIMEENTIHGDIEQIITQQVTSTIELSLMSKRIFILLTRLPQTESHDLSTSYDYVEYKYWGLVFEF